MINCRPGISVFTLYVVVLASKLTNERKKQNVCYVIEGTKASGQPCGKQTRALDALKFETKKTRKISCCCCCSTS